MAAIKIPKKANVNIAEVEAEIKAEAMAKLLSNYDNAVTIKVEAASGNLLDKNRAVGQGLVYGSLVKIQKGSQVLFESADGEVNTVPLKEIVNAQFAMNLGMKAAKEFSMRFHQLTPEERGARRCEVTFYFNETIFVNSNDTIVAEGIIVGDLMAPQGQPTANKETFLAGMSRKRDESKAYRKAQREKYSALAMQQLDAMTNEETQSEEVNLDSLDTANV
jgi:hypothetical protein